MEAATKKSVEATRSTESSGAAAPPTNGTSAREVATNLSLKSTSDKSTSGSSKETPSPKKEKESPDLEKGEWEIVEGLKTGTTVDKSTPTKYEGFMLKKRKWPLKGWHKRFFVLEKGFLKYAKRQQSVQRGKLHGSIDVGLSVMSIMKDARRIDLDTEDSIYHLKLKSHDLFNIWVSKLREHRLWRQNEIASGGSDSKYSDVFSTPLSPETPPLIRNRRLSAPRTMSRSSSLLGQGRVAAWLMESEAMEQCNKELSSVQTKVYQLNGVLQELQRLQSSLDDQYKYLDLSVPDLASKKKGWRLSFRKSKHKKSLSHGGSSTASTASTASTSSNRNSMGAVLPPPSTLAVEKQPHHMSTPNISSAKKVYVAEATPTSPTSQQRTEEMRLRQEFVNSAKDVYSQLKVLTLTLRSERDKLQDAMGQQVLSPAHGGHADRLGQALAQAQAQNADLRARLNRIAREADLATVQTPAGTLDQKTPGSHLQRQFSGDDHLSLSTAESVTEFFDAEEFLISSSSSDGESEDESLVSGESEETMATDDSATTAMGNSEDPSLSQTGHRAQLPCPKPEVGDLSIWSIMRKNIGKDLSKVCMPVTMNEPLNTLQRLAEELEYSELLDKAAETDNPYERMALIAAFAVSGYSSTYYRAGQKPFNPLLGETYECVREDKGFNFIAEQVSHHPPISACHCRGEKWIFWQDARLKTKFWGKSMEIIPIGTVNVSIPKYNDHYTWSKVTSCIHNIMTGQRWMDHYGEKIIKNKDITCRLMFHKASYWSTRCHDVLGSVLDKEGKEVHHLFGKWHEGLWCGHPPSARCVWRPGSMPEEYDLYYGFTRFAVELNELPTDLRAVLPPTDTRFRPDQRMLEEGQVQRAQNEKVRLEQMQRMREREREEAGVIYQPRFFRRMKQEQHTDSWVFNNTYWDMRKNPGFSTLENMKLW